MKNKTFKLIIVIIFVLVLLCGCESTGNNDNETLYTCVFKDENGVVLKTIENVEEPCEELFDGKLPSKEETNEFTYTFSGWEENIVDTTYEYYAQFKKTVKTFKITFKDNYGVTLSTKYYKYGEIPEYKNPTKESSVDKDYRFVNWNKEFSKVTGEDTYTANFEESLRKYLITFVDEAGKEVFSSYYEYGETPSCDSLSKDPTDEYQYIFKGWTPNIEKVSRNMTYKPFFITEKKDITVYFNTENGLISQIVKYGEAPKYDGIPTKAPTTTIEYEFAGWNPSIDSVVYSSITYEPIFNEKTRLYSVKLYDENNDFLNEIMYEYNQDFMEANPVKKDDVDGCYIGSWDPVITTVTSDISLKAKFVKEYFEFPIVYHNSNGEMIYQTSQLYGTTVEKDIGIYPEKASTEHHFYVFKGWIIDSDIVTTHMLIYPEYTEYTIYTYKYSNGTTETKNLLSTENALENCPSNSNLFFTKNNKTITCCVGWQFTSDYVVEEIQYKIVLNNTDCNKDVYSFENNVITLLDDEKNGYTFNGWYTDKDYNNKIETISKLDDNYNLYAKFTINTYNISYELNGGSITTDNPTSYEAFDTVTIENTPTKVGYNFDGWYFDESFNNKLAYYNSIKAYKFKNKYENITIYAKFTPNAYIIDFDSDGGKMDIDTITINYHYHSNVVKKTFEVNDTINIASYNPGYGFVGWYLDSEFKNPVYSEMAIYDGIHLYGKSQEKPEYLDDLSSAYFQVADPGSSNTTNFQNYYSSIGYGLKVEFTFKCRLNKGNNYNNCSISLYNFTTGESYVTKNLTEKYETYYIEGTYICNAGDKIFVNLCHDSSGSNCWFNIYNVHAAEIPATIDYSSCNVDINYDDILTNVPVPTKEGYEFAGWYAGDVLFDFSKQYKYIENITLKAKWIEK